MPCRLMLFLFAALVAAAPAQAQALSPPLAGLAFLVGDWSGTGKSENDTTDKGTSSIRPVVGGNAMLRQDHNDVTDKAGKPVESFDQIMLIYPDGGTLHADYLDGAHTIHYVTADVQPGRSVRFETAPAAKAPAFRLTYAKSSADGLDITFEMQPPGAPAWIAVAKGTVTRN